MRSIFTLLLFVLTIPILQAQIANNFNNGIPGGWITFPGASGQANESWSDFNGYAQVKNDIESAEDWLVTNQISIDNSNNFIRINDMKIISNENAAATYTIRVSTGSRTNFSDFKIVSTRTQGSMRTSYSLKTINLSAYNGQKIYVAFVIEQGKGGGNGWRIDYVNFEQDPYSIGTIPPTSQYFEFVGNTGYPDNWILENLPGNTNNDDYDFVITSFGNNWNAGRGMKFSPFEGTHKRFTTEPYNLSTGVYNVSFRIALTKYGSEKKGMLLDGEVFYFRVKPGGSNDWITLKTWNKDNGGNNLSPSGTTITLENLTYPDNTKFGFQLDCFKDKEGDSDIFIADFKIDYAPLSFSQKPTSETVCTGESVQLNASIAGGSGGYTYLWSPSSGLSDPHIANPVATPNATTHYTLSVSDANNTIASSAEVTVKPLPVVKANASQSTLCVGEQIILTGSGAKSYSWNKNIVNGIAFTPTTGETTYTVTGTDESGCTNTANTTILVNKLPIANAGDDQSIATGTSTTLNGNTAQDAENLTYTWQPANLLVDATIKKPTTIDLVETAKFTLTVTNTVSGCVNTDQVNILVTGDPLEINTISENKSICKSASTQLNVDVVGGTGTYIYSWAPTTGLSDANIANPVATPTESTTYTLTVNDGNNSISSSVDINVNPLPNVTAIASKINVCLGEEITLTGKGANSYTWNNGIENGKAFTPGSGATIYTISGTDANGCTNTDQITITAHNLEANAGNDQTIHAQTATILSGNANGGSGNYSYSWKPSDLLTDANIQKPTTTKLTETTIFTLTVVDNVYACEASSQTTVLITGGTLNAMASSSNSTLCIGETAQLDAFVTGGTGTYTYSWAPTTGLSNANIANPVATPTESTTYTLTVNDGNNAITSSVDISVNLLPDVTAIATKTHVCLGEKVTLTGKGANSYTWDNGIENGKAFTSGSGATIYTISGTDTNGCTNTDQITITAHNLEANAGTDQTIHVKTTAILSGSVSGGSGNYSYSWKPSDLLTDANTQKPTTTKLAETTTFTLTVIDNAYGCEASSQTTVSIANEALNTTALSSSNALCFGEMAQLDASVTGGTGTYTYSWTPTTGLSDANIADPVATPTESTTYTLTVNDGSTSTTSDVHITVVPLAKANFNYTIHDMNVVLSDASQNAETYKWDMGDGNTDSRSAFTYSYKKEGTYTVAQTVSNSCNTDTYSTTISVIATSISASHEPIKFSLFPNPNKGVFNVKLRNDFLGNVSLRIINLHGGVVFAKDISKIDTLLQEKFNLHFLHTGIYNLQIIMGNKTITKLIIIE